MRLKIFNQEADCVYKMEIDAPFRGKYYGTTCFGAMELPSDRTETVAQEWVRLDGEESSISVINFGNYGSHSDGHSIHMTLLNAAAYTAHPVDDRPILKQDRFTERMDMGERDFRFILNASCKEERIRNIEFENRVHQEEPYVMNYFPTADGKECGGLFTLDNPQVAVSAFKRAEKEDGYILRVYNLSGKPQTAQFAMEKFGIRSEIILNDNEFKSYLLVPGKMKEVNILEQAK